MNVDLVNELYPETKLKAGDKALVVSSSGTPFHAGQEVVIERVMLRQNLADNDHVYVEGKLYYAWRFSDAL